MDLIIKNGGRSFGGSVRTIVNKGPKDPVVKLLKKVMRQQVAMKIPGRGSQRGRDQMT